MVDELGGLEDAVDWRPASWPGCRSPPAVIQPQRKFSFMDLLRNQFGGQLPRSLLRPSLPGVQDPLYLMD